MTRQAGRCPGRWGLPGWGTFRRCLFLLLLLPASVLAGCDKGELREGDTAPILPDSATVAMAIESMLHASAAAWNAGNLDGFMDDYWRSPALTFSGSGGVTRGWDNVRARYLDSYFAPGAVRDELHFEGLEISPLGSDHALALGRYVLTPAGNPDGTPSSGFFSLVLRWVSGEWRIIHDHTSATPPQEGTERAGS